MLTPEIKTNLILKEIGIKRYSLRTNSDQSLQKKLHLYQKGNILALLENPFRDFNDQYKDLLRAIISSTNLDKGKEINKTINSPSQTLIQRESNLISTSGLLCLSTVWEGKSRMQSAASRVARTASRYGFKADVADIFVCTKV